MKVTQFYPRKQAKPEYPVTRDFETRQGSLYSSYNALWEEYMQVKDLLDKLLNEQIGQLHQLLLEAKQMKLHLAGLSGEDIDEEDIET